MVELATVVEFWFAPGGKKRWFTPDPDFDAEIGQRFAATVGQAAAGELEHWAATARGALALCLLLDQFPRNIWRGTPRAFSYDPLAREVAKGALAVGQDRALPPEQRLFLYLPSSKRRPADQACCVALTGALVDARVARRCAAPPRRDHALRPLPAPQRHPRAGEQRRRRWGSYPARIRILGAGPVWLRWRVAPVR